MNAWSGVFEAFHSAVIDCFGEAVGGAKLELGLPIRLGMYMLPNPEIVQVLMIEIESDKKPGLVFLASTHIGSIDLGSLGALVIGKVAHEFKRRKLAVQVGKSQILKGQTLPEDVKQPSRLVWAPIEHEKGILYYGLGI